MSLRIFSLLAKVKNIRKSAQYEGVTLVGVLARMFAGPQLEQLIRGTPDRRHLASAAADRLGISEAELQSEVARRTGLTFQAKVMPMDLEILPIRTSINDFRSAGAIAITTQGVCTALVCVDPGNLRELRQSLGNVPVVLGCWISIARALDESERAYLAKQKAQEVVRLEQRLAAARKAIGLVIAEVCSAGSSEVEFSFGAEEVSYLFTAQDGRRGLGSIHPKLKDSLKNVLDTLSGTKDRPGLSTFELPDGGLQAGVKIIGQLDGRSILLDWREKSACESLIIPSGNKVVQFPQPMVASGTRIILAPNKTENATLQDELKPRHLPQVCVIDDNETFARVLERFLSRQDIRVRYVNSARRALEDLKSGVFVPNLIVCDVHMPDITGFDFLRQLRALPAFANLPAIMLTSDNDIETELKLLSNGADAFVAKNEDPRLLCVHVKRLLSKLNSQEAA